MPIFQMGKTVLHQGNENTVSIFYFYLVSIFYFILDSPYFRIFVGEYFLFLFGEYFLFYIRLTIFSLP